ncbi:MTH938/NDUFAF3 family protein [Patescibacteria group bacterium]|nr:MTH938/NDUFAF3 family protein [Patescibacteria group bacterium]
MVKIEKVSWAKVKINSQTYHQALIIDNKILERDKDKLETLFGTTHKIGDWEQKELLSENPEVILIANGWSGLLEVSSKFKAQSAKLGIELRVVLTGKFMKEYQNLINQGKKVNVLIHTTC